MTGLAPEHSTAFPLPSRLGGIQVLVNGTAAPLLLASDSQINFQCPMLAEGTKLRIQVESESGVSSAPVESVMQAAVPVLFQMDATKRGLATIEGTGEIAIEETKGIAGRPARDGEVLALYASGLGEVVDGVPTGTAAPMDRAIRLARKITVVVGGSEIEPLFAGLEPGMAGVYLVKVQLPADIAKGNAVPVHLKVTLPDGTTAISNTVTIAISVASAR